MPLEGGAKEFDSLLDLIGDARLVLIGEATHGTHEFYRLRSEITKRLIREKKFLAVAVEADWPDAYRVNRYVRGLKGDFDAVESMADFKRFPAWMWRNADVLDFIGWLRTHNVGFSDPNARVGFYGLDLYSLHASMNAVIRYLEKKDPDAALRAKFRYSCFDHFGTDPKNYGYAVQSGLADLCGDEAIKTLLDVHRHVWNGVARNEDETENGFLSLEHNTSIVKNAEAYYRGMFGGSMDAWNQRDQHMAETLEALMSHLEARRQSPKIVVWAHNSHVGDARATSMRDAFQINLGQIAREKRGVGTFLLGFTTYHGTVTAASDWGGDAERKTVRQAMDGSYEKLFHHVRLPRFLLPLRGNAALAESFQDYWERAIGVIYLPRTEFYSHYLKARLADQFDAVIHVDETRAVEPLERTQSWERGEYAETFPSGL
jgi:erythromycin esterase-like protein